LKKFKFLLIFLISCNSSYKVDKIIDGDTFALENGIKVRILGIDAPEKNEPFYDSAKIYLENLILNKKIKIEYDIQKYDKYNRMLAYVFVDEKFVNEELIKKGYAWVYIIPPNFKYSYRLKMAEEKAKIEKRGLWKNPYYVASKKGKKFHIFYCPSAKRIKGKNRIIFKKREEAIKRGYKPAGDCNP
jgi:micrococcal nuclease